MYTDFFTILVRKTNDLCVLRHPVYTGRVVWLTTLLECDQASIRDSSEGGESSSQRFDFASIQEENLGCVNFSLCYDPEQSLLTVRLIQVSSTHRFGAICTAFRQKTHQTVSFAIYSTNPNNRVFKIIFKVATRYPE